MPAFSRQKAASLNVMEDIEDDATTQRTTRDDVEESEEEPATHKVKQLNGKRRAQQEVGIVPDSDSDDPIDVENFPNQPLKRNQVNMLQGLEDDWQKLGDIISRPFDKYGMAAGALADLDDDDAKARVEEIDGYMRESLDFAAVINAHIDALNKMRQRGIQGEQLVEVGEVYTNNATANVASYNGKTLRQKYAKADPYIAFKANIWEAQHPGMPMPPITEQLPREQGDNSDEDDDLEIGGVSQNYLCPITLTLLDDPYTSSVCGHSFSANAIRLTFRTPSSLNKCPAAGCTKSFRLADCKPNKDLAKKVKAYKRRLERERELSDAEELLVLLYSKVQESVVKAQSGPIDNTDDFLLATYTYGPLISRIMMTNALQFPMFTITLARNTIDISGHGQLTLGKLPDGVDNSSLTWVPVRRYTPDEGGLRPPTFAPNEVYPFRWEIDIDGVFMDGQRLDASSIPTRDGVDSTKTSALIDTGNSILRGPEDVVNNILKMVSPSYQPNNQDSKPIFPCINPHTLAFQIGGKMFPIDPRDFVGQFEANDATTCVADNLVVTDPPGFGALFRWSLGDPFFRSNLVAFHYGNITHPSVDPPRIGFLSLVPPNADELYTTAISDALSNGGNFEATIDPAPTASAADSPQVTVSIGSDASLTHLSAASTLSLGGTSLVTPTRSASSAFSNIRTWKENVFLSLIVCLSVMRLTDSF